MIKNVNLALRFLLELCALAALAYWGFRVGHGAGLKLLLGLGAPALAAIGWGMFVAPRAKYKSAPVRLIVELALFAAAVAGLAAAGQGGLAIALAVVYAVNRTVLAVVTDTPLGPFS
ncbi:MAG TPA: DUF2568 domain-containing protein [Micromonosporaceae bacterium]|nr:DUF2568 domain-containing protein [Micromonosporaceae bacterium]